MKDWTGIEIEEERQRLELEAAKILGLMHFAYSRLEMELGLRLVWADEGRNLSDDLSTKVGDLNFKKKLDELKKLAGAKFRAVPKALDSYYQWIKDANALRETRNRFFHGRWGVSPVRQQVFNVVGLPTSRQQQETGYSIVELQAILNSIGQLQRDLQALRKTWPV